MHPVGFEPTLFFRNRIMSAMQSTTLPWMLFYKIKNSLHFIISKMELFANSEFALKPVSGSLTLNSFGIKPTLFCCP